MARRKVIKKYILLSAENPTCMEMAVNEYIEKGYRPCGSVSIIPDYIRQGFMFYQGMYLLEHTENKK